MKKVRSSLPWIICSLAFLSMFYMLYIYPSNPSLFSNPFKSEPQIKREAVEVPLKVNAHDEIQSIAANKLPSFTFDLSEQKFQPIIEGAKEGLKESVHAEIMYEGARQEKLEAEVDLNAEKHKLIVHPKDAPNFTPGKYRLSLKLRTLEGDINIEQDFTWGVLAINTNKSIYKPGDVASIGMGVLDEKGETHCKTGQKSADVWLTVTDPKGGVKEYSTQKGDINDSGQCGPISVTNEADFVSIYLISDPGIYKMKMTAEIQGQKRTIEDYFKVQEDVAFDIERKSFPTRIYPMAVYNVLFTITPKEDYEGVVEEFVPSDFRIEKLSDTGTEETVGEFKKLSWKVKLKKGETKKFTYAIHFPPVSPEFYLLGPITIGDFKEARQWQIASDAINSTSGVASWEDNGGPNTWSRVWTGTTWVPALGSAPDSMSTTPGDSRWFREVSSPKTGEKIVVLIDNATNDPVMIFTWNGSSWSLDKNISLGSSSADVTRPFDVAYEELSGDALVVISNYSSNQLRYIKRVDGVWDSATTFAAMSAAGTAYDVYKRWVRLEPQPRSDTILVGYLNNNERVGGMLWDGSINSFTDQFADNAGSLTATSDEQAFDIAWETQSGTPMVFWGTTGNNLVYREYSGGAWQSEATAASGFTNDLDWVLAASDPVSSSNNISLGLQDGGSCVIRFGVWTGSSMTMNGTTHACPSVTTNNLVDTAFENNTGQAMWTFVRSSPNQNQISWLVWTSGGGFTSVTTETGSTTNIEGLQLYADLNTTSMMLLYHDNGGASSVCRLWHREWDGSSWSTLAADPVFDNMCASADNDTEPYGFGFDRNVETMAAYRWFENNNGTSVVNALATQDNPYTLTTANQQFRLRLLLYYPDSLSINGRNYVLQFIDKGTGTCEDPTGGTPSTWTDVGVPGSGTEISYYNNASPADGDNLTSNGGDPTYHSYTKINQDYEEGTAVSNPKYFTNSVSAMAGDQVGLWDFSLVDNTTYDVNPQTFCFRVIRSNGIVLQIDKYPQISTATVVDVLIQSGTLIQSGSLLQ